MPYGATARVSQVVVVVAYGISTACLVSALYLQAITWILGATLVRHEDNMKTMKTRNLRIWLQHATAGLEHGRTWLELDYDFPY